MITERISCAICDGNDTEVVFTKGDLTENMTNVICRKCALVYLNPRMTAEESARFHVTDFLRERHGLVTAEQVAPKVKGSDLRMKSAVADFIVPHLARGARVLDVGAGFGTLLHILHERLGASVEGIELADVDVAAARKFYGIELYHGSLEAFAALYPNRRFDCIALHHTFEHLPHPREALRLMRGLLASGGILYIGVPNIMNIRKRPEIFFQWGHAYSYSPASLQRMLAAEGFLVTRYNRRAAFPGAMELLASLDESAGLTLSEGSEYRDVIRSVRRAARKFALLRAARGALLFWLPRGLRLRISDTVLQWMKHR